MTSRRRPGRGRRVALTDAGAALAVRTTGRLSFSVTGRQPVPVFVAGAYAGWIATTSTKASTLGYGGGLRRVGLGHQRDLRPGLMSQRRVMVMVSMGSLLGGVLTTAGTPDRSRPCPPRHAPRSTRPPPRPWPCRPCSGPRRFRQRSPARYPMAIPVTNINGMTTTSARMIILMGRSPSREHGERNRHR